MAAAEEGGSYSTAGDATSDGLPAAALHHLAQLVRILEAPSKGQMCLESTCGDKGPGAKLESRAEACCNGSCPDCGFRKHWTSGLREFFIDRVEEAGGMYEDIKEDIPLVMFEMLHWGNYAYRLKEESRNVQGRGRGEQPRAAVVGADEDEAWEESKKSKELYVQTRSGTLFDFLDEFEPTLIKHVVHRSTLSRQKAGSLAFDRDRRPGDLTADIDYAENFDIEEARQVQSEHWSTNQCTLLMQVWQWLDVPEWNLEVGELVKGAEVTVGGEKAGQNRAPGAFWAKIVSKRERDAGDTEDIYIVEDAAGRQGWARRSSLRHRVFVKQCHVGVTGDKKHDR